MFVYVLLCQNEKYYVGKTKNCNYRLIDHMAGQGAAWTRKHKPIKIIRKMPMQDPFDEDKYTKIYMLKHGIDNVRGGTYSQLELTDNAKTFIRRELATAQDLCFLCNRRGHFANTCMLQHTATLTKRPWALYAFFSVVLVIQLAFLSRPLATSCR